MIPRWNGIDFGFALATAAVAAVAIALRVGASLVEPLMIGDWAVYSRVAANIVRGCGVSVSDPAAAACVPHFGGNHLPGYPFFIAAVWSVFGRSELAVLVAQSVVFSLALVRLAYAARGFGADGRVVLAAAGVMALSPLQLGWARYGLTEMLALAATIWVFAELLASLGSGRLRVGALGAGLAVALFLRTDGVLLAVPIAAVAAAMYGPLRAARWLAGIALIVTLPLALWTARNLYVGLPDPLPQAWTLPDGSPGPKGYRAWVLTWAVSESQRSGAFWFDTSNYNRIVIDYAALDSDAEREQARRLVEDLRAQTGRPFPPALDAEFAALASARRAADPVGVIFGVPARRFAALWARWLDPLSSFAGADAVSADVKSAYAERGISGALAAAGRHPLSVAAKLAYGGYRFVLFGLALAAVLLLGLRRGDRLAVLCWSAAAFIAVRAAALAATGNIETRYTAPFVPPLELLCVLAVPPLIRRLSGRSGPQPAAPA